MRQDVKIEQWFEEIACKGIERLSKNTNSDILT
jgi:hypothetical protein